MLLPRDLKDPIILEIIISSTAKNVNHEITVVLSKMVRIERSIGSLLSETIDESWFWGDNQIRTVDIQCDCSSLRVYHAKMSFLHFLPLKALIQLGF